MGVLRANVGSEGKVHLRYLVPWHLGYNMI